MNRYGPFFTALYVKLILNLSYGTLALCSSSYMEDSELQTQIFMQDKGKQRGKEKQNTHS